MNENIITISVDSDTTKEELKEIRHGFKKEFTDEYKLNIIVSGKEEPVLSLGSFLAARLNN